MNPSQSRWPSWLPMASVGLAFLVPFLLALTVPYAAGYLGGRVTLAHSLQRMWGNEEWQHCWLVIPIIAYIVHRQRHRLARLPVRGSWWGLAPLGVALLLFWAGHRVENYYIGFGALHGLVIGGVLLLAGWRWLWALAFPLCFLAFAWPLFFLENNITFPLRMVMTAASEVVLNTLGIDVVRQGTGILSAADPSAGLETGERFSVDVADPCSGIRSLFALMMVSALYAYFSLATLWKQWVLFLCSIPLAVAGNLIRIMMLVFGTILFGSDFAIGKHALDDPSAYHMASGFAVFAVALLGLVGIGKLLKLLPPRREIEASAAARKARRADADAEEAAPPASSPVPFSSVGALLGLTAVTLAALTVATPPVNKSQAGVRMSLPALVDDLVGEKVEVSREEKLILPPDTQFAKRLYTGFDNESISAQIVLAGAEKRSIHRPEVCLPGQGWTIRNSRHLPIELDDGRVLDTMCLTLSRPIFLRDGTQREMTSVFLYWFVGADGSTTASHIERILRTNLDMLLHNTNHRWAYVTVSSPVLADFVPGGRDADQTLEMLTDFIKSVLPEILIEQDGDGGAGTLTMR